MRLAMDVVAVGSLGAALAVGFARSSSRSSDRRPDRADGVPQLWRELVGLPEAPTHTVPSLLPCLDARSTCPDVAVSQMAIFRHYIGYTFEHHRLIVDPDHSTERLYDTTRDPYEQRDLAATQPAVLSELRRRAQRFDQEHCIAVEPTSPRTPTTLSSPVASRARRVP